MPTKPVPQPNSFAVFETYKQAINESLASEFKDISARFDGLHLPPIAVQAIVRIAEFTLRPGKRVRGALGAMVYDHLTSQLLSVNGQRLAIVMELVQSYALIVDDVTDQSDFRRGEPSVHRLYEQIYRGKIADREAEQLATYTGLIAGHLANILLTEIDEKPERIVRAVRHVNENITVTSFGQLDDIMQEIVREASASDVIRKYGLKTSYYTFINPLHAGMALAGVTDDGVYQQVAAFGVAAGVAFQTHDDYLGVFGSDKTGKPVIDDIKEGKLTILVQHALAHGTAQQVKQLKQYLGNPGIGETELTQVRAILDDSGATIEARHIAEQYADRAIKQLQAITIWDETFKASLTELVKYSINRES